MRPSPLTAAVRRLTRDDTATIAQSGAPGEIDSTRAVERCAVDAALCEDCDLSPALTPCSVSEATADDPSG